LANGIEHISRKSGPQRATLSESGRRRLAPPQESPDALIVIRSCHEHAKQRESLVAIPVERREHIDVISLSSRLVSGRGNFKPYGISPIGLSFKRPEQEAEYQAFILKVAIAYIRFSLIFGGVALASFGLDR
jgi:hypothetical protein